MKQTITESMFIDAFMRIRPHNFSYNGLKALFGYFEQYEEDTGEDIELDVIAICCEYGEYENLEEFQRDYGEGFKTMDDVDSVTGYIDIDDEAFIIQKF